MPNPAISIGWLVNMCWCTRTCVGVHAHVLVYTHMCWCTRTCVGVHAHVYIAKTNENTHHTQTHMCRCRRRYMADTTTSHHFVISPRTVGLTRLWNHYYIPCTCKSNCVHVHKFVYMIQTRDGKRIGQVGVCRCASRCM